MSCYWDERRMMEAGRTATVLALGDSWFWYPFPGGSLANNLGDLVEAKGHVILAKGMNGAEAYDLAAGKYQHQVQEALRLYGSGLKAVFLSAGGNDFAGLNDLRPLLRDDCTAATAAKDCFRSGKGGLKAFYDTMDQYYRLLIGMVYTRTSVGCHIVMHCYDYAVPNGKGVFGAAGWIKPALEAAKVPPALHQACVVYLIDGFTKMLDELTKMDPAHLHVVHSAGTLSPADWANELHPNGKGFKKMANTAWKPLLKALDLA